MYGGQDKGFALSYSKLSYRRKFIRTVWISIVSAVAGVCVLLLKPESTGFAMGPIAIAVVGGLIQGAYTYRCWKRDEQESGAK
jgi:hypothetical protein